MPRRARAARLLALFAALTAAGGLLVALADDSSSETAREQGAEVELAGAPAPTPPAAGSSVPDLGLPPLPPFPTLVPDTGLAALASEGRGDVAVFGDSLA